ncbi:MAG: MFS transporter [Pseudomonadota bacterium]
MVTFLRTNARWIFGGLFLTFLSSFGQTFFISASVAEWQARFDLSHGDFGLVYMLATLASAVSLPFIGKSVDVIAEHRVLLVITPILAAACVVAAYAPSVLVLGLALFVLRLMGQGMMTHLALTATGRWFSAQRGRAVSVVVLGHQLGEATLPLAFSGLAFGFGYQAGWLAAGIFLIFVGLPLGVWAYAKPRTPSAPVNRAAPTAGPGNHAGAVPGYDGTHWTRARVVRDWAFWVLLLGALGPGFIGTTIFFHQDYLASFYGWPGDLFARALAVMALTTVLFALINGWLIDRFGARAILPFFLLPLGLSCLVLSASGTVPAVFGFMILLGVSYGFSSTLVGALWPEVYGTDHLGAVRALIVSAIVLATAVGPGLTGALIDRGISLPDQIASMAVYCFAISAVMVVVSQRLRRRQLTRTASKSA